MSLTVTSRLAYFSQLMFCLVIYTLLLSYGEQITRQLKLAGFLMTIKSILAAFIMLCLHFLYLSLSLSFCIFTRFLLCCHQHSGFFAILEREPGHYNHRLSQCADQKHPISNYNHMPRYQCCKTFFNGTDRGVK